MKQEQRYVVGRKLKKPAATTESDFKGTTQMHNRDGGCGAKNRT
jgi:hypothetical protein